MGSSGEPGDRARLARLDPVAPEAPAKWVILRSKQAQSSIGTADRGHRCPGSRFGVQIGRTLIPTPRKKWIPWDSEMLPPKVLSLYHRILRLGAPDRGPGVTTTSSNLSGLSHRTLSKITPESEHAACQENSIRTCMSVHVDQMSVVQEWQP